MHNSKNLDITFELCEHGYSSGQGNFVTPTLHRHSSHILLTKNAVFQSRLGPHSLIFGHPASRAVPSSSTQEIFKGRCPLQPFCCHHFANSKAKHQITYNIYNSIKLLIILLVYIMDANHIYQPYITIIKFHLIFPSIWLVIYPIHCSENRGSLTKSTAALPGGKQRSQGGATPGSGRPSVKSTTTRPIWNFVGG